MAKCKVPDDLVSSLNAMLPRENRQVFNAISEKCALEKRNRFQCNKCFISFQEPFFVLGLT